MKAIVLVFLGLFLMLRYSNAQPNWQQYYTNEAIRYDFELVGKNDTMTVIHKQTKILPQWGGQMLACVDETELGNFNCELFDLNSGQLIFRKGFSNLFWEWQTTSEALKKQQSFYQALYFPRPIKDARLVINVRNSNNNWQILFADTLRVSDYFMINEKYPTFKCDTIFSSGSSSEKIDIVILSEGYRTGEMAKFNSDAHRLTNSLFNAEPFRTYKNRFNVLIVEVPSLESGADVPGEYIYKNTAFNAHFYTFNSPRYLTITDLKPVYDALDNIPFDQIYVLVNTDRYGGGGIYNFLNVCTSDNDRSGFVFSHEFAHGFAGLGDEYYTSGTSYEEYFNKTIEPWEPNLTTLVDFNSKWKALVKPGIPIPTPRDSSFQNSVGVFEGGGYESKGVYSPVMSCWMKEMNAGKFCPVCYKTIEQLILSQTK